MSFDIDCPSSCPFVAAREDALSFPVGQVRRIDASEEEVDETKRNVLKLLAVAGIVGVGIGGCAPEPDPALYAAHGVRRVPTLEELFSSSDVVVEVAPLNPATTGIVTERLLRLMLLDHFAQGVEYDFQTLRQFAIRCLDTTAGDITQLLALFIEYAKPGNAQARVDTENAHYSSMTAVV